MRQTRTSFDAQWMRLVEGTLLGITPSGSIVPAMAKSYELVDPQTVRLTLRGGRQVHRRHGV